MWSFIHHLSLSLKASSSARCTGSQSNTAACLITWATAARKPSKRWWSSDARWADPASASEKSSSEHPHSAVSFFFLPLLDTDLQTKLTEETAFFPPQNSWLLTWIKQNKTQKNPSHLTSKVISKRGRARLRKMCVRAALLLIHTWKPACCSVQPAGSSSWAGCWGGDLPSPWNHRDAKRCWSPTSGFLYLTHSSAHLICVGDVSYLWLYLQAPLVLLRCPPHTHHLTHTHFACVGCV